MLRSTIRESLASEAMHALGIDDAPGDGDQRYRSTASAWSRRDADGWPRAMCASAISNILLSP